MPNSLPTLFFQIRLPRPIQAIALWPFVFVHTAKLSHRLIQHERIHLRQQLELGIFAFYIWYILEWLFRSYLHRSWRKGYRTISFEKEAYRHENSPNYL